MGVVIRERFKGEWWIFINHKGRRKSKKIGRDKWLAYEVAKKIEAKLASGELDLDGKEEKKAPSFKDCAEKWFETCIQPAKRKSTCVKYKDLLEKYAYPTLANIPIHKIGRADVRNLLLKCLAQGLSKSSLSKKKGLSRSSLRNLNTVIGGAISCAIEDELISYNPTIGLIKSLHIKPDAREHLNPFTPDEVNLFLKTCVDHFGEYYPFFLCAFRTGMRLGELLALKWEDVDWNGKFIQVRQSYKGGEFSPTKTGKSRRVDMSDHLFETLRALLTVRKKEGFQMALGGPVEGIFYRLGLPIRRLGQAQAPGDPIPSYLPMEQGHIQRQFKLILKKAGLRNIRFHDTRHTYASLLLSDGVSSVYVKEQLGHSSIKMTVDVYGHLIPSSNRAAVNRLDGQFNFHPSVPQAQPKSAQNTRNASNLFGSGRIGFEQGYR